jgi:hypothetical protein
MVVAYGRYSLKDCLCLLLVSKVDLNLNISYRMRSNARTSAICAVPHALLRCSMTAVEHLP